MKMKKFLAIILSLALLMALAACGTPAATTPQTSASGTEPTSAPTTEAPQDVKMRMGWWGSQTRHNMTIAVIEMYEEMTGVDIEYEFYAFDGYITKLNTLVASNEVWDIFQLGGNYPTYIESIELMNDYVSSGVINKIGRASCMERV